MILRFSGPKRHPGRAALPRRHGAKGAKTPGKKLLSDGIIKHSNQHKRREAGGMIKAR